MRRALLLILFIAGCARTAGAPRARAHAGSDVRVQAGATALFAATCEGCSGKPEFHWSIAVGAAQSCTLAGETSADLEARCTGEGAWVLRLDVADAHGAGIPDYANLTIGPQQLDAGELDAGPTDAGAEDAGPLDAGSLDAGELDSGALDSGPVDSGPVDSGPVDSGPVDSGPVDSGPLNGALVVTFPDGTPAVDVLPGDLLELHASSNNPFAACTFDAPPANAQYLASTNLCDTAIALLAPATGVTFGVTFNFAGQSAHSTSTAVTAHGATSTSSSVLAADTVAADPVTHQVIASRPGHSTLLFTPGQAVGNWNGSSDGVTCAGGGVREVAWHSGDLGRVLPDGGRTTTSSSAGDFISCAEAPGNNGASYQPILAATDGTYFAAWAETGNGTEDNTFNVDLVANVEDPASAGDVSAGVLTLSNGDTLQFVDWAALHDFALNQTSFVPQSVPTALSGLTTAVTGPWNDGTLWLADDQGTLWEFQGTLLSGFYGLGFASQQLSGDAPVTGLAVEHSGPYAQDLWISANGAVERVTSAANTVGALPTLLHLDVGAGSRTVDGLAADQQNGAHAIYLATSGGLYVLAP